MIVFISEIQKPSNSSSFVFVDLKHTMYRALELTDSRKVPTKCSKQTMPIGKIILPLYLQTSSEF